MLSKRRIFRCIPLVVFTVITWFVLHGSQHFHTFFVNHRASERSKSNQTTSKIMSYSYNVASHVQILNPDEVQNHHFSCITTKTLLGNISTKICLYDSKRDIYVSGAFRDRQSIWEESEVTHVLRLLLRHPNVHLIDIGANIGTYTVYAAALGRFVLSIDCFRPNLIRLRHALQLAQASDRVVLVNNAIYQNSGRLLRLAINTKNIGGQGLYIAKSNKSASFPINHTITNHSYLVRTIQFDDLLPILRARSIQRTLIKIDIEGSESYVLSSGTTIFDTLDIPWIQMEWSRTSAYPDRVQKILTFFALRDYQPSTHDCKALNPREYQSWPKDIYWIKRHASDFC